MHSTYVLTRQREQAQKDHHRQTLRAITIVAIAILTYLVMTTPEPTPRYCFSNGDQAPIACNN